MVFVDQGTAMEYPVNTSSTTFLEIRIACPTVPTYHMCSTFVEWKCTSSGRNIWKIIWGFCLPASRTSCWTETCRQRLTRGHPSPPIAAPGRPWPPLAGRGCALQPVTGHGRLCPPVAAEGRSCQHGLRQCLAPRGTPRPPVATHPR